MVPARVHSIETFGAVDGPGIRFVVFLKGCALRCKFCHNADTWNPESRDIRTADELLSQALRYRNYWGKEGGITVSGGEPLLQIDLKHIALTGKPNDNILDMFRCLSDLGKPIWIRQVLVPGWTDDPEDLAREAAFIRTLSNVKKVEVLPYHTMGAYKWEKLGIPYPLAGVKPPDAAAVARAEQILTGRG